MSGNPVSIQHQRYARLLSENTLQGTGTHRTSGRQAQTLQAYRTSMREDGAELRLARRACSWPHLDQIRPHGLVPACTARGTWYCVSSTMSLIFRPWMPPLALTPSNRIFTAFEEDTP